ncbi:MAG TPA: response regulator [Bacteroidota bacterium]
MRILIAINDASTLSSLSYVLLCNGMEVTACKEFDQAVDALTGTWYDLLITDIGMPDASIDKTLKLLGFIKRHFCSEVIVTADRWKENEDGICRLHGLNYVIKPFEIREVLTICARIAPLMPACSSC